jgi:hypothetical protein
LLFSFFVLFDFNAILESTSDTISNDFVDDLTDSFLNGAVDAIVDILVRVDLNNDAAECVEHVFLGSSF